MYANQSMTENTALYAHRGHEEIERRIESGYPRVYMRQRL